MRFPLARITTAIALLIALAFVGLGAGAGDSSRSFLVRRAVGAKNVESTWPRIGEVRDISTHQVSGGDPPSGALVFEGTWVDPGASYSLAPFVLQPAENDGRIQTARIGEYTTGHDRCSKIVNVR